MPWNKAASTVLPGCLVLLSKSTFFFSVQIEWHNEWFKKKKRKKVKGQITNVGHLWYDRAHCCSVHRHPGSQPARKTVESLCGVIEKFQALGLGETDWKFCCWLAVWPKPNLSKFLCLENGNNINNDAPPAYFSLPRRWEWFLSVIHSSFNPIYFSRCRHWGTVGWSGTVIVTDGTRGRAGTGVGVSELSLPHCAEYKRTHGHLLSDILAALGSTGIFFFSPSTYFWNTSLQFSCPNGL